MRLMVRILGLELIDVEVSTDQAEPDDDKARDLSGGSTSSYPVGFTPSHPDPRWEEGLQP